MGAVRLDTGCDLDPAAGDVVADRVRDEVGGEPLEQVRVAARPGRLELDHPLEPVRLVGSQGLGRGHSEINRFTSLPCPRAAGEHETCLEQPLLLPAGPEGVLADLSPGRQVRIRVGKCELEQGTLGCQGRPQLMRHVGGETLAALEGCGQALEEPGLRSHLIPCGVASSAHLSLAPLSGRPAGISFWQVASALSNWAELVLVLEGMLSSTLPFWKLGSGKSGKPCLRMQAAPSR